MVVEDVFTISGFFYSLNASHKQRSKLDAFCAVCFAKNRHAYGVRFNAFVSITCMLADLLKSEYRLQSLGLNRNLLMLKQGL